MKNRIEDSRELVVLKIATGDWQEKGEKPLNLVSLIITREAFQILVVDIELILRLFDTVGFFKYVKITQPLEFLKYHLDILLFSNSK